MREFQEIHERHDSNFEAVVEDLELSEQDYDKGDIIAPELAQRYRYYQEMRGYVTDLVECLDEKVGLKIRKPKQHFTQRYLRKYFIGEILNSFMILTYKKTFRSF